MIILWTYAKKAGGDGALWMRLCADTARHDAVWMVRAEHHCSEGNIQYFSLWKCRCFMAECKEWRAEAWVRMIFWDRELRGDLIRTCRKVKMWEKNQRSVTESKDKELWVWRMKFCREVTRRMPRKNVRSGIFGLDIQVSDYFKHWACLFVLFGTSALNYFPFLLF